MSKAVFLILTLLNLNTFAASYLNGISGKIENKKKDEAVKNKLEVKLRLNSPNQVKLKTELKGLTKKYKDISKKEDELQDNYFLTSLYLELIYLNKINQKLKKKNNRKINKKNKNYFSLLKNKHELESKITKNDLRLLQLKQELGHSLSFKIKPLDKVSFILQRKTDYKFLEKELELSIKETQIGLKDAYKMRVVDSVILAIEKKEEEDIHERVVGLSFKIPLGTPSKDSYAKLKLKRSQRNLERLKNKTQSKLDLSRELLFSDIKRHLSLRDMITNKSFDNELQLLKDEFSLYQRYIDYVFESKLEPSLLKSLITKR